MSKEMQDGVSQAKRGSRKFLKNAILVLGASAILQPAGAVFGLNAQETPKKDGGSVQQTSKPGSTKPAVKTHTKSKHKGGKKKEETPKKEG